MLVTLIFSLTLLQSGSQTLLQQIVPNPTGTNGYEEYLMACEIVRPPQVSSLILSRPENYQEIIKRFEKGDAQSRPSQTEYSQAKKFEGTSLLKLRREAVERAQKALDLIAQGNKKNVFDPRTKVDWNDRFPEMRHFRILGTLCLAASYVAFADGQPVRGAQYLADAITFGRNIGGNLIIGRLNGMVIQESAFELFESVLPKISHSDGQLLLALSNKLVSEKSPSVRVLERGQASNRDCYAAMLELPTSGDMEGATQSDQSAATYLKTLSATTRQEVLDLCVQRTSRIQAQMTAMFQRPESEWGSYNDPDPVSIKADTAINSTQMLVAYLCDNRVQSFGTLGRHEVRNRTQLRLIGLAAAVVKFKWEYDRLPLRLSEVVGEQASFDPVANGPFQYETSPNGFRVYSKGTKESGEIGLRYDYSANAKSPPPSVP